MVGEQAFHLEDVVVWTACVTPFYPGGAIDWGSFESRLKDQERAGNGILLLGSTGEGISLGLEEKKALVRFAVGLGLRVPLMVALPADQMAHVKTWAAFCADFPVASFLASLPPYIKPGIHGQVAWFETLLDGLSAPLMLYNIPGRTGVSLGFEAVKRLGDHPGVWAVKDSGGVAENVPAWLEACGRLRVYCGDDPLWPMMASLGAVGLVSVISNVWPQAVHDMTAECRGGAGNGGIKDPARWKEMCAFLAWGGNPVAVKAVMYQRGLLSSPEVRFPLDVRDVNLPDRQAWPLHPGHPGGEAPDDGR